MTLEFGGLSSGRIELPLFEMKKPKNERRDYLFVWFGVWFWGVLV
jgi:hypothetical protein